MMRKSGGYTSGEKPTVYLEPFPPTIPVGSNPKDKFGSLKVSYSKLPAAGVVHGSHAMMDGARKYGPYNWRDNAVIADIYVDAAKRHLDCWYEGQECAEDSKVHHLGHVIACCSILLDALYTGNLIDNRPKVRDPNAFAKLLDDISLKIKEKRKELENTPIT